MSRGRVEERCAQHDDAWRDALGAALYNNGSFHLKDARFGESYSESGEPQTLLQTATEEERRTKGFLSLLDPIPRWEISQPGNILRVFERGGKRRLEVGLPD